MYVASQTLTKRIHWDQAEIGVSCFCVLLTPLLVTALPAFVATEHETHSVFAVIILLLGVLVWYQRLIFFKLFLRIPCRISCPLTDR